MGDADRNDIAGVGEEILLSSPTQNGEVPISYPNGKVEESGMMVVERQEASAVAVTPLVRL